MGEEVIDLDGQNRLVMNDLNCNMVSQHQIPGNFIKMSSEQEKRL